MVRNQNLLVIITILLLAIIIIIAKNPRHFAGTQKHYLLESVGNNITIAYGPHVNGGANLLDLYLPETQSGNKTNKEKFPLIVFIHGGGWQSGDKMMLPDPLAFTGHGYAIASINYRLTSEAAFPAQIEDCLAAIQWLHKHANTFNMDPDRVGVWGVSSGGHLAALLGTTSNTNRTNWAYSPCRLQAVCDWCGPTDLITMSGQAGGQDKLRQAVKALLRGTPQEKQDLAKEASPITYVSKGLPPFLIMHGEKDNIVPPEQSKELADALKAAGVKVDLRIIHGAGHNIGDPVTLDDALHFFDRTLKKPSKTS